VTVKGRDFRAERKFGFFICSIPYIHTSVVQEVYYYRDCSPEVDNVQGMAAAAIKHLELLKQKDKAESSFIIENIVGKLLRTQITRPFPLYLPPARFQWIRVLPTL
jgi:hypothetical protein